MAQVELTVEGKDAVTLDPVETEGWFHPERGMQFERSEFLVRGDTLGEAFRLGTKDTFESMTLVFQLLRKIFARARVMGGPVAIAKMAYASASQGVADFALFLMMISANLAVLNFLPIPVLDGGHMVFLAYEGITGKPPDERVHVGLTYLGLLLILALMVWVFGLDLGLISRH